MPCILATNIVFADFQGFTNSAFGFDLSRGTITHVVGVHNYAMQMSNISSPPSKQNGMWLMWYLKIPQIMHQHAWYCLFYENTSTQVADASRLEI